MYVYIALFTISGTFWTIAYVQIIRLGFRDRTYGIPLVALAANLTFETHWTLRTGLGWFGPIPGSATMPHATMTHLFMFIWSFAWMSLDFVVFYQFWRFGRREFPHLSTARFVQMGVFTVLLAGTVLWLFQSEIGEGRGVGALPSVALAFMDTALLVGMLYQRQSLRGQSFPAAVTRTIADTTGCLAITTGVMVYSYPEPHPRLMLMWVLCFGIISLDTIYSVAVFRMRARTTRAAAPPAPRGTPAPAHPRVTIP